MADENNAADALPPKPDDTMIIPVQSPSSPNPEPATAPTRASLLGFLGRSSSDSDESRGFVGALIVGAVALVIALMALTVAIGRSPQSAIAGTTPVASSASASAAGPTTYSSPPQTGVRYTPQPIITGVTQHAPSYEASTPTPSATSSTTTANDQGRGNSETTDTATAAITFSWNIPTIDYPGNNPDNPWQPGNGNGNGAVTLDGAVQPAA